MKFAFWTHTWDSYITSVWKQKVHWCCHITLHTFIILKKLLYIYTLRNHISRVRNMTDGIKKWHKVSMLTGTGLFRPRHVFHSFDSKILALKLRFFWWSPTGSDAEAQKFYKTRGLSQLKLKRNRFTLSAWFCKAFEHKKLICCRERD